MRCCAFSREIPFVRTEFLGCSFCVIQKIMMLVISYNTSTKRLRAYCVRLCCHKTLSLSLCVLFSTFFNKLMFEVR